MKLITKFCDEETYTASTPRVRDYIVPLRDRAKLCITMMLPAFG